MPTASPRMGTAAVYEAPNTPFVLKEFPLRPVQRGEVLVRVSMSTICRSDIQDANMLVKRCITMRGVHNYHPRHLIVALDFVMANRGRFPFKDIVGAKFALKDLDAAFHKAAERSVLRAAVVP